MERRAVLRINISTLRIPELRSLLATARARGQEALVEQIEAEIAARGRSRPAKPAPLAFEEDEVLPIDPGTPEFEPEPPEDLEVRLSARARRPPAPRWAIGVGIAAVLTAGAAGIWGLGGAPIRLRDDGPAVAPSPSSPPRAMTVRTDATAPTASPAEPEPPPARVEPEPTADRPARLDPCAPPPSPADRLLCSDLGLNLLDHEMRQAYGRAIDAGADPAALRESQAAWRRTRNPIDDPRALAEVYDRRIRELQAAAAPPPP